eukprot:107045-Hanusia_phi.AAC.1
MLDGSGDKLAPEETCSLDDSLNDLACRLENSLPQAHMFLEAAFISEQVILSDESLVLSFPSDALISVLYDALGWLEEMSFKLDQVRTVEAVKADLDALLSLKDPEPLIHERLKLKQDIQDLDEELMDQMHILSKRRWKNSSTDDVEAQISTIRGRIRSRARELEDVECELWHLVGHYPEYKSLLMQEVNKLVGSSEDDGVGLFTSYDSSNLYEDDRLLSVPGQQGARHYVRLVHRGEE